MTIAEIEFPAGSELVVAFAMNAIGQACVPVMSTRPASADWQFLREMYAVPDGLNRAGDPLLEVVIDALPVPRDDVPLEDILDYCRDAETRGRRERLMLALARAQLENRTPEQFSLDLEEALVDFEQHMRVSDLKTRRTGLRLAIGSGLGVIEELVKLRPRRALDAVFEYRTLQTDRLEAELQAKGNQAAFIYQAEKTFGPRNR